MSFFDFFGTASNKDTGLDILHSFYDEAKNYVAFTYPDFDSWMSYLDSRVPNFAELIGELVLSNSASTTVDQAKSRLYQLANRSGGEASIPDITKTAGGSGDTINWLAAVPEVTIESVEDVAELAQSVGQGVASTLNATKYLPWILGGAAVLYIAVMAGSKGFFSRRGLRGR